VHEPAEDYLSRLDDACFDTALCYNVLQHTIDPELIYRQLRRIAHTVRVFEWVEEPPSPGHPHRLRGNRLAGWLGGGDFRDAWMDEQYNEVAQGDAVVHGWGGVAVA